MQITSIQNIVMKADFLEKSDILTVE